MLQERWKHSFLTFLFHVCIWNVRIIFFLLYIYIICYVLHSLLGWLLDDKVVLCLSFWRTLSIIPLLIYAAAISKPEFPIRVLIGIYQLFSLKIAVPPGGGGASLWFWFLFPWWLLIWSSFPCASMSSWEMSISAYCILLNLIIWVLLLSYFEALLCPG